MGLPNIPSVIHSINLNEYGIVEYRPFLVKEYKSILKAKEFGDDIEFIKTIRNILENCTFGKININNLPIFLIDYLFLMVRSKSLGEIIVGEYTCQNKLDDDSICNKKTKVDINLNDVYVKYPNNFNINSIIKITDNIGIKLKYPTLEKLHSVNNIDKDVFDIADEYIYACVECVYDGDAVSLPEKDFKLKDFIEFMSSMPVNNIDDMTAFFKNQPMVCLSQKITCNSCQKTTTVELNGINDFFV